MLIRNATLADGRQRDVRVRGESIAEVARDLSADGERTLDVNGKRLFPGMIDAHVHFRQPGYPHKETWETGSRAGLPGLLVRVAGLSEVVVCVAHPGGQSLAGHVGGAFAVCREVPGPRGG